MSTREQREQFRQALADLGHPEATAYSHWALEAYDRVHHPELRKPQIGEVSPGLDAAIDDELAHPPKSIMS
jgi:hypothetical protein